MRRRGLARLAVAGALVVLLLGGLLIVRPYIAFQRDYPAEIPSPAALQRTASVPLAPAAPVCFKDAVIDPRAGSVRFAVFSQTGPAPPLRLTLNGTGGYSETLDAPAGTQSGQVVALPVTPPPVAMPIQACFFNLGRREVGLLASDDRTRSRSDATIGNRTTNRSIWFSFYEPRSKAITERIPLSIERMTIFRPDYVGKVLLWILLALFIVGMPVGIVWAYVRGLREDEATFGEPLDVRRARPWWRRWVE